MKKVTVVLLLTVFPLCIVMAGHKRIRNFSGITDSAEDTLTVADCIQCMAITDQAVPAIDIVDVGRGGKIIWSWRAGQSNIPTDKIGWFSTPDDAKPVYNLKYLLINASGGGVALVRIADKKAVFYAYVGKNPHSSELLPDGNIVTASSTDNRLVIFHVDQPEDVFKRIIPLPFAHNVVWDKKQQVRWPAGDKHLYKLKYNFNKRQSHLTKVDSFPLPGRDAHDLFPVYGKDSLWFTNPQGVYIINMHTKKVNPVHFKYNRNIKSVSSGPSTGKWPVVIIKPETKWWPEQVTDSEGNSIYFHKGMKIYKSRWVVENAFSYGSK